MIYTIDNPKLVKHVYFAENNFTGVVQDKNGDIAYYENGLIHRTDGPAIIYASGEKSWCIHGELHREDGPALECANGYKEWFYEGKRYGIGDDFIVDSWIKKIKFEIFE